MFINSKASASELLENLEEMRPRPYIIISKSRTDNNNTYLYSAFFKALQLTHGSLIARMTKYNFCYEHPPHERVTLQ